MPEAKAFAPQFVSVRHRDETAELGMWVFIATEVLLFGGLILAYFVYLHMYPAAFAAAITSVLCDPVLRARLARGGRALVESSYAWNVVGDRLRTALLDLVANVGSELQTVTSSPA